MQFSVETANELVQARLEEGGTVQFVVPTESMVPVFLPGDLLLVRRAEPAEVQIGDIVVVQSHGAWLAHRLVAKRSVTGGSLFVTKGDWSPAMDAPWPEQKLAGIVASSRRKDREFSWSAPRMRPLNRLLARVSYLAGVVTQWRNRVLRYVAYKSLRVLLRMGGSLARHLA